MFATRQWGAVAFLARARAQLNTGFSFDMADLLGLLILRLSCGYPQGTHIR